MWSEFLLIQCLSDSLKQEEALQAFVQPETLDGANQYFCERCKKKCDARKVSTQTSDLVDVKTTLPFGSWEN